MARILILTVVGLVGSWAWSDDEIPPGLLEHRNPLPPMLPPDDKSAPPLGLAIPFGERLKLTWFPFAGSGPFHFENLSSSPYYAHMQDVEYGVRLGFDLTLTDNLHIGLQVPYIYNPAPLASIQPGPLSLLSSEDHFDLALGLSWTF